MRYEIKLGTDFIRKFKRLQKKYRSIDKDFECPLDTLEANPFIGADLGNGIRKIRMAIRDKAKGKSHGAQVIT